MINAAVIGLGRWGQSIVEAVQGKSRRLRIIRGVSKEPALVRDFAAAKGFELSTDFGEAIADPRVQAVFLATPHSLHVEQITAVAALGKPVWSEKPLALTRSGGRARHCRNHESQSPVRPRQQQALLCLDARTQARGGRRHARRGSSHRGQFQQRTFHARARRLARRSARVAGRRHDRRRPARARRFRQSGGADRHRGCARVFAQAAARSARRGGRARRVQERRHRRAGDHPRGADGLAHPRVRQPRAGRRRAGKPR